MPQDALSWAEVFASVTADGGWSHPEQVAMVGGSRPAIAEMVSTAYAAVNPSSSLLTPRDSEKNRRNGLAGCD